jgi:uroporphyrin-III C-methyltransferase
MNKNVQLKTSKPARRFAIFVLLILLFAVVIMTWQWAEKRGYITDTKHFLMQYLDDADVFSNRTRRIIAEIESKRTETEQRLNQLAASSLASDNQQLAAETLINEDVDSKSDAWILGTVKHLIVFSDQHLQLTGNVHAAIATLEHALELLQTSEVLGSSKLSAKLTSDIEQLKMSSNVNILDIYQDIESYFVQVDDLPLAMETQLVKINWVGKLPNLSESSMWRRYLNEVLQDCRQLVSVKKLENPDVPLLSHSQAKLLRENIKLQLTLARLALLTRDESSFRSVLITAVEWMNQYFDTQDQSVKDMLETLDGLSEVKFESYFPDLRESLEAVKREQLMLKKGEDE